MGEPKIEFLTLEDASVRYSIAVSTLRAKIYAGELPAYKVGKPLLVKPDDMDIYMKRHKVK